MRIHIPHIFYTLTVKRVKRIPNDGKSNWAACWKSDGQDRSIIYIKKDEKEVGIIAHEVIHVLQHICEVRSMDFEDESEHTAYLMKYIMDEILKQSTKSKKVRKVKRVPKKRKK